MLQLPYFGSGFDSVQAYDYLITFETEKKYVWDSTWKLGKILYILTRYSPMIDAPMLMACMCKSFVSPMSSNGAFGSPISTWRDSRLLPQTPCIGNL
jgi:hypothetical protein